MLIIRRNVMILQCSRLFWNSNKVETRRMRLNRGNIHVRQSEFCKASYHTLHFLLLMKIFTFSLSYSFIKIYWFPARIFCQSFHWFRRYFFITNNLRYGILFEKKSIINVVFISGFIQKWLINFLILVLMVYWRY